MKKHINISVWWKWVSEKCFIFSAFMQPNKDANLPLNLSEHLWWLEMTWLCVVLLIQASQIPVLVTALGIYYFSSSRQKKNRPTRRISNSNKALMNFHYDGTNSHVPAVNLLEFLVHALSITSYHSRERIWKEWL